MTVTWPSYVKCSGCRMDIPTRENWIVESSDLGFMIIGCKICSSKTKYLRRDFEEEVETLQKLWGQRLRLASRVHEMVESKWHLIDARDKNFGHMRRLWNYYIKVHGGLDRLRTLYCIHAEGLKGKTKVNRPKKRKDGANV